MGRDIINPMASNKMMLPVACTLVILFASYRTEGLLGINWGRESAQRLLPSQVVDLLLQNGIGNARVYTAQKDILMAFAGSGINLTISVLDVQRLQSIDAARVFVQDRYEYFISSNIRCIYVGGLVFAKGQNTPASLKTLRSLQSALNEYQLGQQVKVNFVSHGYLLKPNYSMPSEAEFLDEVKVNVRQYLRFLEENDAPFPIQLIPVIEATSVPNWDVSFGFPDGKSNIVVKDDANGFIYTNVMAFKIDSFVWALTKLNFSNIKVTIGQVGWPTDGYKEANASNAERFWKHFLPWVTSTKGTPMRPGVPIDTFMHAVTDETKTIGGGPLTRHWGIYRSNGEPKYRVDFTGRGRDVFPSTVRGVMRMPRRWCMFNGDRSDSDEVNRLFRWACEQTDCSCLAPGGSCSGLSYEHNVSYAFNLYFQFQFQDEKSCDFNGLASLSSENPSAGDCVFPVEVVKGRQDNYNKPFSYNTIFKPTV